MNVQRELIAIHVDEDPISQPTPQEIQSTEIELIEVTMDPMNKATCHTTGFSNSTNSQVSTNKTAKPTGQTSGFEYESLPISPNQSNVVDVDESKSRITCNVSKPNSTSSDTTDINSKVPIPVLRLAGIHSDNNSVVEKAFKVLIGGYYFIACFIYSFILGIPLISGVSGGYYMFGVVSSMFVYWCISLPFAKIIVRSRNSAIAAFIIITIIQ